MKNIQNGGFRMLI